MRAVAWNRRYLIDSPFARGKRTEAEVLYVAQDALRRHARGELLGFAHTEALRAMGRLPDASGRYRLAERYAYIAKKCV